MQNISEIINKTFLRIAELQANFVVVSFFPSLKGDTKYMVSLIKYDEDEYSDNEQEYFHDLPETADLESDLKHICKQILSSYPKDIELHGNFRFHYRDRRINSEITIK